MEDIKKEELLIDKYTEELEHDPEFIAEGLAIKFIEEMLEYLKEKGHTQTWLAEQMGVSKSYVSNILNAQPNMTLLTIGKIAAALKTTPDICLDVEPWKLKPMVIYMPAVYAVNEPNTIVEPRAVESKATEPEMVLSA